MALVVIIAIAGGVGGSLASKKDVTGLSSSCELHANFYLPAIRVTVNDSAAPYLYKVTVTGLIQLLTVTFYSGLGGHSPNSTDDSGLITISGITGPANSTGAAAPVTSSNFAAVNWDTNFIVFYQDSTKNIRMV